MATDWYPRTRNYITEKQPKLPRESVTSHPLKNITVSEIKKTAPASGKRDATKEATTKTPKDPLMCDFVDPLSAVFDGGDPLTRNTGPRTSRSMSTLSTVSLPSEDKLDDTFEPWYLKKPNILAKYTTSEKLSITTSFLSADDKEKVVIKMQSTVTDKVKNRLEQLDDFEEGSVKEMLDLSQQEYVKRIEQLNQALIEAWERDQRVKALKIAIQCAKLLSDTSVIQFYPSKFVLITDILDTFGKLVYARLRDKAQYYVPGSNKPVRLPEDFAPEQVPDAAKETCKNWFFKIASIRELIPRIYVEMAIIDSYRFLDPREIITALQRLSLMVQGVGDPLVAIYTRCYLCRVGMNCKPSHKDYIMEGFKHFLFTYSQISSDHVQNTLAVQKLEMPQYLTLYPPALDWILQCVAYHAPDNTLQTVLDLCNKQCKSALLLNSIMTAFQPDYIAERALQFTELIKECDENGLPKHFLHRTLGLCLLMSDPAEDQRLTILNEVWKVVMKLNNPQDYISCAEVWIEYVAKHFGKRELNTILGDIIKHMIPDRAFETYYLQLQSIASKVVSQFQDFAVLFSMDKFLPFVDMFQKESVKVDVCKTIVEAFNKHQAEQTSDPVVINTAVYLCKAMHDSINALTLEDTRRQVAVIIRDFINKISFGRDFEQQLSFYVEARASFSNLDPVLIQLVHNVNKLSMDTRHIVKASHSRKTAAFVRACAAFCFITTPSLDSCMARLQLYLCSGQVALVNQCLSQADACFKAAISLIPELPKVIESDGKTRSSEPILVDYLYNLLSTLVIVPDNPDVGVMYLIRGLLSVLQDFPWDPSLDSRALVYTRCLAMLSTVAQESLPYHVDKVDSNDSLYGGDPKFISEVNGMSTTVLSQVLTHLKSLATPELQKRQATLSLELFNILLVYSDLGEASVYKLAVNLWGLATRSAQLNDKTKLRAFDYAKRRGNGDNGKVLLELLKEMPLNLQT